MEPRHNGHTEKGQGFAIAFQRAEEARNGTRAEELHGTWARNCEQSKRCDNLNVRGFIWSSEITLIF